MSLSEEKPQVGQDVNLFVDVLVKRREVGKSPHLPLQHARLTIPELKDHPAVELAKPLELLVQERPGGQGGFHLNHVGGKVALDAEPTGPEKDWYRYRLSVPLNFKKAGSVELPAARSSGEVYVPTLVPMGKSVAAAGKGKWESFVAPGEPLTFKVSEGVKVTAKAKQPGAKPAPPDAAKGGNTELPPLYEGSSVLSANALARPTLPWVVGLGVTPLVLAGLL